MTKEEKELLYKDLEKVCPSALFDQVIGELEENEEEIKDLKGSVSRLEEEKKNPSYTILASQVGNFTKEGKRDFLKEFLKDWSNEYAFLDYFKAEYPDLQFQDGYLYITIPQSHDGMFPIQVEKLEECINQHGVEEVLNQLTSIPQY